MKKLLPNNRLKFNLRKIERSTSLMLLQFIIQLEMTFIEKGQLLVRSKYVLHRYLFMMLAFLFCTMSTVKGQSDTEFWFVAPEVAQSHADDSVKFRFAGIVGTTISITLPGDITNPLFPINGTIPASGSLSIRLTTAQKNLIENKPVNSVLKKGLRITSSSSISAYYEVNSVGSPSAGANNPEIFALKGQNALGVSFVIPAQNIWGNGPVTSPAAKSGIEIVATEDGTTVTVTMGATANAVGHAAGSTFTITLNKGETYSIEQQGIAVGNNLSGTVVTSNKKIAITIKEDSVYLNGLGGCYDLAGDQMIPTDIIGNKYIVAKGSLYNVSNPSQQLDKIVIMPATAGATITVYSGSPITPTVTTVTRGAGQIYVYDLTSPSVYIEATAPVYVYHYTGYGCEVGSAIVPPILCTGARKVSAVRSVDNTGYEFQLVVFAPSSIIGSFDVNGNPALTTSLISAFAEVPGTAGLYKAAKVSYSPAQIAAGQNITVTNPAGLFHAGIINGDETTGARYGFFSDYSRLKLQSNITNDISCFNGQDGELTVAMIGGLAPYTYQWSNGSTTQSASNLPAGIYQAVVTDASGCRDSVLDTIAHPTPIVTNVLPENIINNCIPATSTGSALVTATGGTGIYGYSIDFLNTTQGSNLFTGLQEGNYTIIVQDANSCTDTTTFAILDPNDDLALDLNLDLSGIINICLPGSNGGQATINVVGGFTPYQFSLNGSATLVTDTVFSNLTQGGYFINAIDNNGCKDTVYFSITEPATQLSVNVAPNNITHNCVPGGNAGQAIVTATGGYVPYNYSIVGTNTGYTSSQSGNEFSGLQADLYTLTVTDSNNCSATTTFQVLQPTAVLDVTLDADNITCNGLANGIIQSTVAGGFPTYEYSWSNGATIANINSLNVGNYTLVVTDINGCIDSASAVISQPMLALSASAQVISDYNGQNVSCNGSGTGIPDGIISATPNGGTMPYTYLWSNGAITQTVNGVGAGTYSATVTDANGCFTTANVTVTEPTVLTSTSAITSNYNGQDISCNGAFDGAVTINPLGGTAPYTYLWSNGSTSQSPSGLLAGAYSVVITDANGCTSNSSVTVSQPIFSLTTTAQVISNYNGQDVSCNGSVTGTPDGIITATPNGGTAPYTYLWSNGATTQTVHNVGAATYTITVTDVNGCSTIASVAVTEPTVLTSSSSVTSNFNGQDVSCNGATNGSVSVSPVGGTAPYTYAWSNGATTQTVTGVGAGTYNVTITDANGCTTTSSVTVTQPAAPVSAVAIVTSNFNGQDVSCNSVSGGAPNGSISVTPAGGTAPYTYLWSNGSTSQAPTGVGAGVYNVTVTDANGCAATTSVTVTQPPVLTSTSEVTSNYNGQNISCNGATDGSVSVTPVGGTAPYTYAWSTGSTSQTVSGLSAGTCTVTVTDANGCTTNSSVTVTQPAAALSALASVTSNYNGQNISCNGASDGAVTVNATGGTAPYTYLWSNGSTSQSPSGLVAGTYNVTVTDVNGCSTTATMTVNQPTIVTATSSVVSNFNGQNVSCNSSMGGVPNGSISATPNGGTVPYTYLWSNGSTSQTVNGIGAGSYNVTVTDANGCVSTSNVTITEPPVLTSTSSVTSNYNGQNISCNGAADGSVSVLPVGGTAPYTYLWNNGSVLQSPSGLSAGTYTVTVTDANGCSTTSSVIVTQPSFVLSGVASVTSNYNGQNVSCVGSTDGSITVIANGGTSPYSFLWSNGSTSQSPSGLGAGTYSVIITDVNGCSATTSVTIVNPSVLSTTANVVSNFNGQNVSCNSSMGGTPDGTISASPTGGTTPYSYLWSNGAITQTAVGIGAGSYNVIVTDANGCNVTAGVTVTEPPVLTSASSVTSNYNGQNISCYGASDGSVSVSPVGGTSPYTYLWSNGSTSQNPSGLSAGTYTVTVTDANGCTTSSSVTVTQPTFALSTTATVVSNFNGQNVSCNSSMGGTPDGIISASPVGGTAPYTYLWSNGATTQTVNNVAAGTYTVTVTDVNGCNASASVTVIEPPVLTSTSSVTSNYNGQDVSCNGSTDGSVIVNPVGGTSPYTYSWNNGSTSQSVSGLGAGTYNVIVTDANGCTINTAVTVTQPAIALSATANVTSNYNGEDVSCNGSTDGSVSVSPIGGTAPYTYLWSNGSTSQTPSGLGAGTYNVTITDVNGCSTSTSVTVSEPTILTSSSSVTSDFNGQNVSCNSSMGGAPNGTLWVMPVGGTAPFSYAWSNGSTSQGPTGIGAGTYSVTVTDINGCTSISNVSVTEPPVLTSASSVTSNYNGQNISCNGASDGSVSVSPVGGTSPYTYLWSNGSTSQNPSGLSAGTYTVTVTDANVCATTSSVTVTEPGFALSTTAQVISNYNGQDVSCNAAASGTPDGIISATPTGGTAPYTYLWSNGATTQTVNNVGAGSYTVTVTDLNGCNISASVTVTEPPVLTSSSNVTSNYNGQDVSCNGSTDGSVIVNPVGGTSPYTYSWNNGSTSQSVSGLGAGTYNVIVTDANGCTINTAVTVTQPAIALSATANVTSNYNGEDVSCNGSTDGSVSVSPIGGTAPYTYLWSNGSTSQTPSGLGAGTYNVTITDVNGCSTSTSVTVSEPTILTSSSSVTSDFNGQNVSCNSSMGGAPNGTLWVMPVGGTAPFSYAWSNGSTSQGPTGIGAGTYSVTVTDINGCTSISNVTVTEPPVLTSTSNVTSNYNGQNISCNGASDGSVSVSPVGGTSPYTYLWSNGSTSQNPSGLSAGTYTVTVTDANGCATTSSVTVTEPGFALSTTAQVISNYNGQDVSCNAATNGTPDGIISATPAGGTAPYTYLWSNGATTQTVNNVGAGTYTVTVTDLNGCNISASVTVTEPPVLTSTSNVTSNYNGQDVSCNGSVDGSVIVNPLGGISPYSYSWSNGSSLQNPSGLGAGTYTVVVTDANGCLTNASVVVSQPATVVSATATVISNFNGQDVSCNGSTDGVISATPNGGTAPYIYLWSNGVSTQINAGLGANTYSVIVSDVNGCNATASVTVNQPAILATSSSVISNYNGQDVSCNSAANGTPDGSISTTPTGGTLPYSYQWSNGNITSNPTSIGAGTYNVVVTDVNGCTVNSSVTVTEPTVLTSSSAVTSSFNGQNISCNGGTNGAILVTPAGGTTPYNYLWSNGSVAPNPSGLAAGNYSVVVTDANGCTTNSSVTITQPAPILLNSTVTNVLCFGNNTGVIDLSVSGGVSGYTFNWSNGQTTEDASGLVAGTYSVTVTDTNGCTVTHTKTVTQPSQSVHGSIAVTDVSCFGGNNGSLFASGSGGAGNYSYQWTNGPATALYNVLSTGTYEVTVSDANGCQFLLSGTVGQPAAALSVTGVETAVLCFGDATGSVDVTVSGGTSGYSYLWSNGSQSQDLNAVAAGNYTLTVTDANGCTNSAYTANITEPQMPLHVLGQMSNVKCFQGSDAAVDISVTGGTSPYQYFWSNGSTTEDIQNIPVGTYLVTVTDANGCQHTSYSASVTQASSAIQITGLTDHVDCYGDANGSINIEVTGGEPAYSFEWSNGSTSQNINNLPAGTYSVLVDDGRGCRRSAEFEIVNPSQIVIVGQVQDNLCYGAHDGGINISVSGGIPSYQYSWSNGNTTEDIYLAIPGNYVVNVSDNNGCSQSANFTIYEAAPLTISIDSLHQIFVGESVMLETFVDGGTGSYTYTWTPEDYLECPTCGSTMASPVGSTNYVVTVTDENNCSVSDNSHVIVNHDIFIPNTFTPNANGNNETFAPVVRMAKECSFRIFNRWGEQLYSSMDVNQGWDGTLRGTPVQVDVYVYQVKVVFLNGDEKTIDGKVTLLR